MGTQIFITNILRIVLLLTFSLREKENFSPIIFFIHKISTKVIIVLVCVTYNIQCMKVTFLTVNIKLFLQWLLSSKGYQFSISRFSNANLLYIYFSEHCLLKQVCFEVSIF
jgi:hypothetical protein